MMHRFIKYTIGRMIKPRDPVIVAEYIQLSLSFVHQYLSVKEAQDPISIAWCKTAVTPLR